MPKQLEFEKVSGWGGRRKGAGRPNQTGLPGHLKRETVNFKAPLHITLRLKERMPRLRNRQFLNHFKQAITAARRLDLRVVHYSILGNHIHLIVEAKNNQALARGMKSLCGSLGKFIRRVLGGVGSVWRGRYHLNVLVNPTKVRNALQYVLLNQAKHGRLIEHFDDFSSANGFKHWSKLLGRTRINGLMQEQLATPVEVPEICTPVSWLLQSGWQKAALA